MIQESTTTTFHVKRRRLWIARLIRDQPIRVVEATRQALTEALSAQAAGRVGPDV
jgi:hypothetical protein